LEIPTGFMRMPEEGKFISIPPRSLAEKGFNIVHWTEPDKGGHFAALETGSVFAEDVRAFAKQVKG
ncbi:MAG TPA: epoxide hydrolase, partial [Rhodobiaceae bacterium]|nr:epoxide hydrolase [Rhodobiaceae bacterium]